MKMKTCARLTLALAAAAVMAGCAGIGGGAPVARIEPTYKDASESPFLNSSKDAVGKLLAGLDVEAVGPGPVLVATVVDVNDTTRSAPLGRTLSEQYATHMAMAGFNVKEIKLRGTVFVREGTGELLLSREVRDIARQHNAAMVLVGTYSPASTLTYVSLKLVRTEDSRIIRGHDYALPMDRDIKRLLGAPR
ncbi:FlgO family outer membrane protein [Diaphorobacter ruginosibacter]|uniref:FlgO family outer membrane protein n=1 Tax=Diaphorobacter ruginosibacter TaxID=1715720 RepID=UPI0033402BD9